MVYITTLYNYIKLDSMMKNSGDNLMKTEGEESGKLVSPERWICISQEINEEPSKSRKQVLTLTRSMD